MKNIYFKALSFAIIAVMVLSLVPIDKTQGQTQEYTQSFLLLNKPDGDVTYELNVTIPQVLYQYYSMQSHALYTDLDFAKFVTPYALKPIADKLWQIYNNTEDFTNGVLMLVHQITYQEIIPGKYPVETLVAGNGDCDLFAEIAASILEAGGIPTVLLFYRTQQHMEIGVDLGSAPTEARVAVYSVNVQNVPYYIAECTGSQWRDGWRVGETPTEYQNVSSSVVTLENMEQSSIGQVSANIRELDPSTLTLQISPSIMLESSRVTISGQILPETAKENVTLQAKINNGGWTTIANVTTQEDGRFQYNWAPATGGMVVVQASWLGNRQYNGAESAEASVVVMPIYIVMLTVALVSAVIVLVLALVKVRHRKSEPIQSSETEPPPISPP
jgi:energy-converting hydrogenase Eha subunit A